MRLPREAKAAASGLAVGMVATLVLGFSWGGWVTGSTAEKMAKHRADTAVVAALLPVCIAQSQQDPKAKEKLAGINAAAYYSRGEMVEKAGWANIPGTETPDRGLAAACASKLGAS